MHRARPDPPRPPPFPSSVPFRFIPSLRSHNSLPGHRSGVGPGAAPSILLPTQDFSRKTFNDKWLLRLTAPGGLHIIHLQEETRIY